MADEIDWKKVPRWERLKWARKAAGYETATDACTAFGWPSLDTYRSHEREPRGKSPGFNEEWAERYAQAFRVDWLWLLHGQGAPKSQSGTGQIPTYEQAWEEMAPAEKALAIKLFKTAREAS